MTGMSAPATRAAARASVPPSGPALGAGGPAKIWPSTPTWLNPPPSASTRTAASIADGTIKAALDAA
jgi:hypothetical protein